MDQDITHAVGAPTPAAGTRPRYSMAVKMVVHPPVSSGTPAVHPPVPSGNPASGSWGASRRVRMAHPAWGEPEPFASAVSAVSGWGAGAWQ
jgi:hypothetical protein